MPLSDSKSCVLVSIYKNDSLLWLKKSLSSIDLNIIDKVFIGIDGLIKQEVHDYLISLDDNMFELHAFKKNRGLAYVLNDLINVALSSKDNYQFFFRVDSDDINLKNRFGLQKNFMLSNPDVDVLGGCALVVDYAGEIIGRMQKNQFHAELLKKFPNKSPFIHPTVCFRRKVLERENYPVNTIRFEDFALWSNLILKNYKLANLNENLIKYRLVSQTTSRRSGFKKSLLELKVRCRYLIRSNNLISLKTLVAVIIFIAKVIFPNKLLKFFIKIMDFS
jgi:hypothetical protein